jgi:hypothetical protein
VRPTFSYEHCNQDAQEALPHEIRFFFKKKHEIWCQILYYFSNSVLDTLITPYLFKYILLVTNISCFITYIIKITIILNIIDKKNDYKFHCPSDLQIVQMKVT